jgi:anti-sigma B factor antagonist
VLQPFTCSIDGLDPAVCLRPSGDLDASTAATFRQAATAAILRTGVSRVDVDLAALSFVDSSGLREVIDASRLAAAHDVELTLQGATSQVRRTFVMVGLERLLEPDDHAAG